MSVSLIRYLAFVRCVFIFSDWSHTEHTHAHAHIQHTTLISMYMANHLLDGRLLCSAIWGRPCNFCLFCTYFAVCALCVICKWSGFHSMNGVCTRTPLFVAWIVMAGSNCTSCLLEICVTFVRHGKCGLDRGCGQPRECPSRVYFKFFACLARVFENDREREIGKKIERERESERESEWVKERESVCSDQSVHMSRTPNCRPD